MLPRGSKEVHMAIFLTVLKWIGIILLILLALVLIILLAVLLVPLKYEARAAVNDPESHEQFPVSVLKEQSNATVTLSWFLGALKVIAAYPSKELLCVKVFGKDIGIMDKLSKGKKEEPEEEKQEPEEEKEEDNRTLAEKAEASAAKAEKITGLIDYIYRVLTSRCGQRALAKIEKRLLNILIHVMPYYWNFDGTVGLSDPCLNGRLAGASAILSTISDDHLQLQTQWDLYRCNLETDLAGELRLIVPVKEAVPLVFDKDCRKLLKKLKRAKAKLN